MSHTIDKSYSPYFIHGESRGGVDLCDRDGYIALLPRPEAERLISDRDALLSKLTEAYEEIERLGGNAYKLLVDKNRVTPSPSPMREALDDAASKLLGHEAVEAYSSAVTLKLSSAGVESVLCVYLKPGWETVESDLLLRGGEDNFLTGFDVTDEAAAELSLESYRELAKKHVSTTLGRMPRLVKKREEERE